MVSIYEGVVEPSYRKQLGQTPNILITLEKLEDDLPFQNQLLYGMC